ncbi:aldo/keto reductase [Agriterribacter sp.]|uniref:aldo/keto reductase n=1 Tax=Agriterribacter sp. TaxID=2821509 RepID=UPI002C0F9AC8|nr:aldo/keto reductase [Agriterribacter sp.]HRP57865.1 aldo/keto reductase [Agriterribacter sp.]
MMQRRFLGNTGIAVSEIAFGGVEIGLPYGIGVKWEEDMLPEQDAVQLLLTALDCGLNFFDTARMYGVSENIMGRAFAGRRDEIVLCTKCRHFRDNNGNLPGDGTLRKIIRQSIEESLRALQTDYIDLYMLHQGDMEILDRDAVAGEMQKLKAEGLVRSIGVSVYSVDESEKAIRSGVWNTVQLPFNLMDQRQQSLFSLAEEKGVGIVVRSVLLKGLLSNRGTGLHPMLAPVEKHIQQYRGLLNDKFTSLPELAVKFALSFPQVSSVLVGMDKFEYLKQSLAAADGYYLSKAQLEQAQALQYPDPAFLNLPYWDKMGWLR